MGNYCNESGETPHAALENLASGNISIPHTGPLVKRFQRLQERLAELINHQGEILLDAIFPNDKDWARPFHDLASTIEDHEFSAQKLQEFLRTSISQPELPTDVDYIRIMSLHKSKGLTAELVVVVGCVEGLIPARPRRENTSNKQQDLLGEQRRLFYVAITRCKKSLILSSVTRLPRNMAHELRAHILGNNPTNVPTQTSRFLSDLGPTLPPPVPGSTFLEEVGF